MIGRGKEENISVAGLGRGLDVGVLPNVPRDSAQPSNSTTVDQFKTTNDEQL